MTAPAVVSQNPVPAPIDLKTVKARQQGAWSSGDYAVVGTTLQIVGEELCEALDVRSGQKVLDVAAGNGNVSHEAALAVLDQFEKDYADRQVPITLAIERELSKLLGAKGKNERDMILAATAKVHGLVIVTRNVKDFHGRGVRVLDPFKKTPKIEIA